MRFNKNIFVMELENSIIIYNAINGCVCNLPTDVKHVDEYLINMSKEDIYFLESNLFFEFNEFGEHIEDILLALEDKIKYSRRFASFTIHLNYNCNLKCKYCYQNDIKSKIKMTKDVEENLYIFFKKVRDANHFEKIDVSFIGGEPMLEIDLILRIISNINKIFKKINISYSIITNGTLINEENIKKLKHIKFSFIQVTLDGSQNIHDKYRIYKNDKGSYNDIISNLLIAQKHNWPIIINCNLSEETFDKVQELFCDLKRNTIRYPVIFSNIFDCESTLKNKTNKKFIESEKWYEAHKTAIQNGYTYAAFYRMPYFVCGSNKVNDLNISPKGDIFKCISGMEKEEYYLDHINNYGTSQYYKRLSQFVEYKNKKDECFSCKYSVICGGWCRYKKKLYGDYCPYNELENNDFKLMKFTFTKEFSSVLASKSDGNSE